MGGGVTANGDMTSEGSAIVTGASRGIGAAIAQALAADGWTVGVNYRSDADGAAQLAEAIADSGGHAVPLAGDVRLPADLDTIFGAMEAEHGPVLVLVNNAGVRVDGLAPQIDDEAWAQVVETNLS